MVPMLPVDYDLDSLSFETFHIWDELNTTNLSIFKESSLKKNT